MLQHKIKTKINNELIKQDINHEENKKCTFKPNLSVHTTSPRTFDKFLKDQDNFLEKRKKNLTNLSKIKINAIPKIDCHSVLLANRSNRSNSVYNKLYESSRRKITDCDNLCETSIRTSRSLNPKLNSKVLQGFKKEFEKAVYEANLLNPKKVTFTEMISIMTSMRFVKDIDFNSNEISVLIKKLWASISSEPNDETPLSLLEFYIATIMNIKLEEIDPLILETINTINIKRVAQEYSILYWNRQSNKPCKEAICEYSFKPILCRESILMAKKLKQKCTKKFNGNIDESSENHKSNTFVNECTFKPKINTYKKLKTPQNYGKEGIREQFNSSKSNMYAIEEVQNELSEKDRDSINTNNKLIHKSKSPETKKQNEIVLNKKVPMVTESPLSICKTLCTMNKQQLRDKQSPLRFLTKSSKTKDLQKENPKQIKKFDEKSIVKEVNEKSEVLLYINVNFKGVKKRIAYHNGDTAKNLAENFAIENGLDDKKKIRLEKMINSQISQLV